MARVKICPSCQVASASNEPFCGCGFVLADVEITESDITVVDSPNLSKEMQTAEQEPRSGTWREAPASELSIRPVLKFPWGDVEVPETLFVGREPSLSPLADRLKEILWVSAKHAELYVEDGVFYVRDVGSLNGTFVNDIRIEKQPIALADGDQVAFSKRLVATVRLS